MKPRIAIIGAGIAGLTLARRLQGAADITVFEKARGVGGRMSTRREGARAYDHGTQYFTGRSRHFREFLAPWRERGVVAAWEGKVITLAHGKKETDRIWFEPHYVAVPGMNALCKALAETIDVTISTEISAMSRSAEGWTLTDKAQAAHGPFDWVLVTAPAPQASALIGAHLARDHPLNTTQLQACYATMLGFDRPWDRSWIAAKCDGSPLGWISADHSKPGRDASVTRLVLHSSNAWADENLDMPLDQAEAILLGEFTALTGIDAAQADHRTTHRWKYALVVDPDRSGFYCDAAHRLGAVGDWSVTSRIEEVWFAATELADTLRTLLK